MTNLDLNDQELSELGLERKGQSKSQEDRLMAEFMLDSLNEMGFDSKDDQLKILSNLKENSREGLPLTDSLREAAHEVGLKTADDLSKEAEDHKKPLSQQLEKRFSGSDSEWDSRGRKTPVQPNVYQTEVREKREPITNLRSKLYNHFKKDEFGKPIEDEQVSDTRPDENVPSNTES